MSKVKGPTCLYCGRTDGNEHAPKCELNKGDGA